MSDLYDEIMAQVPRAFPPKRRRKTPRKDLEAGVLRECIQWLRAHPQVMYVERRNTGAVHFADGHYMRFGQVGAADLWCIIRYVDGRGQTHWYNHVHVEIECKRRDGRGGLSPGQRRFKKLCEDANVPYFVVRSAEDLEKNLREAGLIP